MLLFKRKKEIAKCFKVLLLILSIKLSTNISLADSFVWQTNDNQLYQWSELLEETLTVDELLNWSALGYYKVSFNLPLNNGGQIIGEWFLLDNDGNCGDNFIERTTLSPTIDSYFYETFNNTSVIPLDLGTNITSNPFILANDEFEIFLGGQTYNSEELTQKIGEYFLNKLDTSSWEKNKVKNRLKLWFDDGQGGLDWLWTLTLDINSFWGLIWQDSSIENIFNIQNIKSLPIGTTRNNQCWLLVFYKPIKTIISELLEEPYYTIDNGNSWIEIPNCDDNQSQQFDPSNLVFPNICFDYSTTAETIIRSYSLDFINNNNSNLELNIQEEDTITTGEIPLYDNFFFKTLENNIYDWGEFINGYQYETELLKKLEIVGSYKANFTSTLFDGKTIEGAGFVVGDTDANCGINFQEKDDFAPSGESYLYSLFANQGVLPFPLGDVSTQDFVLNWLGDNSLIFWSEIKTLFDNQVDDSEWDQNKVKKKLEIGLPDSANPDSNFWSGKVNLEDSFWGIVLKENTEEDIFNISNVNSLNFRSSQVGECGLLVLNKATKITIDQRLNKPYYSSNNGINWYPLNSCNGNPNLEFSGDLLDINSKCYHYTNGGTETVIWTYDFKDWLTNQGTNFSLSIEDESNINPTEPIEAGWPINLNFTLPTAGQNTNAEIVVDDYLWVRDLFGLDNGYEISIQITDLISSNGDALPASNVSINIPNPENIRIAQEGTNNSRVEVPSGAGEIGSSFVSLDTPKIWVKRETVPNFGVSGTYGVKPTFKIDLPKYKKPGHYLGELVYTIFNY